MNENLEYNFIQNQLHANNQIRAILNNEITTLSNLIHQKRQWLDQMDNIDRELEFRANAIGHENKTLVKYE